MEKQALAPTKMKHAEVHQHLVLGVLATWYSLAFSNS
jgi:hypothetical protein